MSFTRGFRGATTVEQNEVKDILIETKKLVLEMIQTNHISAVEVSHIFFSLSPDLNAAFPAKVVREIPGWTHVPVMCMQEVDVPQALEKCIRVMLVANTTLEQDQVQHIFLNKAIQLRPDLTTKEGD